MRDLTCIGAITFRPRTAADDDPALVTPAFRKAAQKQGLADPLTGLKDPRLKNPDDSLLDENWIKNTFGPEPDFVIYRYEVGGKTIQYYARSVEGAEVIATFIHNGEQKSVEHIVKQPDGSITRSSSSRNGYDPAWENGYPDCIPTRAAREIYGDLSRPAGNDRRALCR